VDTPIESWYIFLNRKSEQNEQINVDIPTFDADGTETITKENQSNDECNEQKYEVRKQSTH
jgi:hypothetical protein